MATDPDPIDAVIAGWRKELPALDPSPLAVVGRVLVLAQHLELSVAAALAPFDLTLGQFDILATLRRHGPTGELTPTRLLEGMMLSSGGMTGRLDKLEAAGLIARQPDPGDRRGIMVRLTAKGRDLIDAAAAARFAEAKASLPPLSKSDTKLLAELLRTWLRDIVT